MQPSIVKYQPRVKTLVHLSSVLMMGSLCLHSNVWAAAATWTNTATGNLDGINFTVAYTNSGQTSYNADLSTINYSYQPLSASQAGVVIDNQQDITFTFASPITNLLLYGQSWRGTSCGGSGIYTFNSAPTIKSGFSGATISGNDLTVGTTGFASGILSFTGPLTTLTINSDCTGSSGNGYFTLATSPSLPSPVSAPLFDNFNQSPIPFFTE